MEYKCVDLGVQYFSFIWNKGEHGRLWFNVVKMIWMEIFCIINYYLHLYIHVNVEMQ